MIPWNIHSVEIYTGRMIAMAIASALLSACAAGSGQSPQATQTSSVVAVAPSGSGGGDSILLSERRRGHGKYLWTNNISWRRTRRSSSLSANKRKGSTAKISV